MSEICTHEQVAGIIGILCEEVANDVEMGAEERGDATRRAIEWLTATDAALRAEVERLLDLYWREVESLRERLDKEEEERGRQYGMRVQAEERAAFLLELLRATVRTGTKDPLLDARLAEEIRSHE